MVATTVQPCSVICLTSFIRESDIFESNPLVGSSNNKRAGLPNNERATLGALALPTRDATHKAGGAHHSICTLLEVELFNHSIHLSNQNVLTKIAKDPVLSLHSSHEPWGCVSFDWK